MRFPCPSKANALTFNWSFAQFDGKTVSGNVSGVEGTNNVITTVVNVTQSDIGGLGTYTHPPSAYSDVFTVTGGAVSNFNWSGTNGSYTLYMGFGANPGGWSTGLSGPGGIVYANDSGSGSLLSFQAATPVPFDIPGGATIPVAGSLLALGAMRKAKKA
jgi:hypothetical protein